MLLARHPARRSIQSHPSIPLIAPRCYIRLWRVIFFKLADGRWEWSLGSAFFPSFLFPLAAAASFFICKIRVRPNCKAWFVLVKIPNSSVAWQVVWWACCRVQKKRKRTFGPAWHSAGEASDPLTTQDLWKHGMSWEVDHVTFGKPDWTDWELFQLIKSCDWLTSSTVNLTGTYNYNQFFDLAQSVFICSCLLKSWLNIIW